MPERDGQAQWLRLLREASTPEEPGAGNPHAGICAGGSWATGCPTAMGGH